MRLITHLLRTTQNSPSSSQSRKKSTSKSTSKKTNKRKRSEARSQEGSSQRKCSRSASTPFKTSTSTSRRSPPPHRLCKEMSLTICSPRKSPSASSKSLHHSTRWHSGAIRIASSSSKCAPCRGTGCSWCSTPESFRSTTRSQVHRSSSYVYHRPSSSP